MSDIAQYRTTHGQFVDYYKRFHYNTYTCKCGELETNFHILFEFPLLEEQRKKILEASPQLDILALLNSPKGLQRVAAFIPAKGD